MNKEVKRGYVKWTDENGVFHKEPLADHPAELSSASPRNQLAAEEARRLNAAAEEQAQESEDNENTRVEETLHELQTAPDEILTAGQLNTTEEVDEHSAALEQLRRETSSD